MPGKGKEYKSYGKRYKMWLFDNEIFALQFSRWFITHGSDKLAEKRAAGTPIYNEYYNYAKDDLLTFYERLHNSMISPPDASPSPTASYAEIPMDIENDMILEYEMSPDDFVDAALNWN